MLVSQLHLSMTGVPYGGALRPLRRLDVDPLVGYAAGGALLASVLFFLVRAAWGGQQRAAAAGPAYIERRDRSLGGRVVAL